MAVMCDSVCVCVCLRMYMYYGIQSMHLFICWEDVINNIIYHFFHILY